MIVGELGDVRGDSARVPFNQVIHHLPEVVPDCAWASARDICTDGLHFKDAAAYRAFGVRYAEAYLELAGKATKPGASQ